MRPFIQRFGILLLWVALLLLAVVAPSLFGQSAESDFKPIVVELVGYDQATGAVLYHRQAFLFFGPIEEYGYVYPLVAQGRVSIERIEHPDGERCSPVAETIVEKGSFYENACVPPAVSK